MAARDIPALPGQARSSRPDQAGRREPGGNGGPDDPACREPLAVPADLRRRRTQALHALVPVIPAGWLYVRFIGMQAKALWNEYVLTLHRLGWDLPENLPEPPL